MVPDVFYIGGKEKDLGDRLRGLNLDVESGNVNVRGVGEVSARIGKDDEGELIFTIYGEGGPWIRDMYPQILGVAESLGLKRADRNP